VNALEVVGAGGVDIPTVGFGLAGATLKTIAAALSEGVRKNRVSMLVKRKIDPTCNWPQCLAVQERAIFGFRPRKSTASKKNAALPTLFCLARLTDHLGVETGMFIHFYNSLLNDVDAMHADSMYDWFNRRPVKSASKCWITPDGKIHPGNVSL